MTQIPYGRQYIDNKDVKLVSKSLTSRLITTGKFVSNFSNPKGQLGIFGPHQHCRPRSALRGWFPRCIFMEPFLVILILVFSGFNVF